MKDLSILVCDESNLVRTQMIEILTTIGVHNIIEAKDGQEAVTICSEMQPNLVFMGIIMPKKDGIAALKQIKQKNPQIKVVMTSSSSGHHHLRKSLLLGAHTFIQKPVSEVVIRDIIYNYLNEQSISSTKV